MFMKDKIISSRFIRWLSSWKIVKYFSGHPFFSKFLNYEVISYLIVGVLTTVVNYVVYFLMPRFGTSGIDVVVATGAAWVAAVAFAFFANKIFVFDSPSWDRKTVMKELPSFITARLLSLGFDALFTFITIGRLRWNEPLMKILSNIFVLIANYAASKFFIFKKTDSGSDTTDNGLQKEDNEFDKDNKEFQKTDNENS